MDLGAGFVAAVRKALGLRTADPDELWRHGLYRARVEACAADGSTVDVTPEDPRLPARKAVPVRVGVAGAQAVVSQGAVVLLGWEAGDPARCYAVPSWEAGATVTKLVLNASTVILGGETGAQFVALANKVGTELDSIATKLAAHKHIGVTVGAGTSGIWDQTYTAGSVAASNVKAK